MNNCVVMFVGVPRHLDKRASDERCRTVAGNIGHTWPSSLEPALSDSMRQGCHRSLAPGLLMLLPLCHVCSKVDMLKQTVSDTSTNYCVLPYYFASFTVC